MSNTVNDKFVLSSFDADFELLLTNAGYGVLVEGVELDKFDSLDGVRNYVESIVSAVREGVEDGRVEARIDGSYGRIPRGVVLKLIVLLRSHGVQLRPVSMRNSEDFLYWGRKQLK